VTTSPENHRGIRAAGGPGARAGWVLAAAAAVLLLAADVAGARPLRLEGWVGGGFAEPDYDEFPVAVGRIGLGVRVYNHVSLGASVQVDRDRWFGFGYAGLAVPEMLLQPFARFYAGRRDDVSDVAYGWSAGLQIGPGRVKLFGEVHGIIQPGSGTGASLGISF
jgi:hypothetical protein